MHPWLAMSFQRSRRRKQDEGPRTGKIRSADAGRREGLPLSRFLDLTQPWIFPASVTTEDAGCPIFGVLCQRWDSTPLNPLGFCYRLRIAESPPLL